MKREIAVFLIITMVLSLSACGKTLKGTDGLIEKAREEYRFLIPIPLICSMQECVAMTIEQSLGLSQEMNIRSTIICPWKLR